MRAGRSCDQHLTVNSPPPPVLPVSRTFSALPVHSHACSPLSSRLPSPPPINPHLSTHGWTLEGLGLLLPTAAQHRVQIQGPPKRAGTFAFMLSVAPNSGNPSRARPLHNPTDGGAPADPRSVPTRTPPTPARPGSSHWTLILDKRPSSRRRQGKPGWDSAPGASVLVRTPRSWECR